MQRLYKYTLFVKALAKQSLPCTLAEWPEPLERLCSLYWLTTLWQLPFMIMYFFYLWVSIQKNQPFRIPFFDFLWRFVRNIVHFFQFQMLLFVLSYFSLGNDISAGTFCAIDTIVSPFSPPTPYSMQSIWSTWSGIPNAYSIPPPLRPARS